MYLYSRRRAVVFSVTNRLDVFFFKAAAAAVSVYSVRAFYESVKQLVESDVWAPRVCLLAVLREKQSQQIKTTLIHCCRGLTAVTERSSAGGGGWIYSPQQLICWILSSLGLVFDTHLHIPTRICIWTHKLGRYFKYYHPGRAVTACWIHLKMRFRCLQIYKISMFELFCVISHRKRELKRRANVPTGDISSDVCLFQRSGRKGQGEVMPTLDMALFDWTDYEDMKPVDTWPSRKKGKWWALITSVGGFYNGCSQTQVN